MDDIDPNSSSGYSGTFRWKATKILPALPNRTVAKNICSDVTESWVTFFLSRFSGDAEGMEMLQAARADWHEIRSERQ